MQTFTLYSDFEESLRALDLKRLGKQRVEVIQIVRALTVPGYAVVAPGRAHVEGLRGGAWALRADLVRGGPNAGSATLVRLPSLPTCGPPGSPRSGATRNWRRLTRCRRGSSMRRCS